MTADDVRSRTRSSIDRVGVGRAVFTADEPPTTLPRVKGSVRLAASKTRRVTMPCSPSIAPAMGFVPRKSYSSQPSSPSSCNAFCTAARSNMMRPPRHLCVQGS